MSDKGEMAVSGAQEGEGEQTRDEIEGQSDEEEEEEEFSQIESDVNSDTK